MLFKPIRSIVKTIVKLAPFCIPTCSMPLLLSILSGPLLNYFTISLRVAVPTPEEKTGGREGGYGYTRLLYYRLVKGNKGLEKFYLK